MLASKEKNENENENDESHEYLEQDSSQPKEIRLKFRTNQELAEKIKAEANVYFNQNEFKKAIELYTQAIQFFPTNAIYYSNRSLAFIKIEEYVRALEDANKAIELDPKYIKAYFRRGCCHLALGKYPEALQDLQKVMKIAPNDKDVKDQYDRCRREFNEFKTQQQLSKEIKEKSIFRTIHPEKMEVEPSYVGPKMGNHITLDFVKAMMQHFKEQKLIHKKYLFQILKTVKGIFEKLPTLVDITIPPDGKLTICGDIHGQYYDLLNIFDFNGLPSETNPYLFNGDFVDRGSFSCEVIITLLAFKALYPNHVHLSRGNHECRLLNKIYGFEGEVKKKYNELAMQCFSELFCYLPLAHVINNKIYVVHGGLFSQDGITLERIRNIQRVCEPPETGLIADMLWADPQKENGWGPSKRGVGKAFGPDVVERFLKLNNLDLVIRSHEVRDEGYDIEANGKLITVFSAPNYCDQIGNKGAIVRLKADLKPEFVTFKEVPHPKVPIMAYANPFMWAF
jgi:serine/threonine-protein phosphatase 5